MASRIELTVRAAQLRALNEALPSSAPYFIGRDLCKAFAAADLPGCTVKPYTTLRQAPLTDDEVAYLTLYLAEVGERAHPHLAPDARELLGQLLDPSSERWLFGRPDFYVISINLVARAIRNA